MDDRKDKLSEKELKMIEEADRIMEEVNSDPNMKDVQAPPEIYERLMKQIREHEEYKSYMRLSQEDKELIRLGKLYKKYRRRNKYLVLAAVFVLALGICITSLGGTERVFRIIKSNIMKGQIYITSNENIDQEEDMSEDLAYEEIEEVYGFAPLRLGYLPEGTYFIEAKFDDEVQRVCMLYGQGDDTTISYIIRPNYRDGSWGKNIEDELLEEYEIKIENTIVLVRKFLVEENMERWLVVFQYKDASYSLYIMNMEKAEVEKIIKDIHLF